MTIFYMPAADAFVNHQTDAPVIAITAFERGFNPIYTQASADDLNHGRYTPEVLEAALIGSMFGWRVPGARPAVAYLDAQEQC